MLRGAWSWLRVACCERFGFDKRREANAQGAKAYERRVCTCGVIVAMSGARWTKTAGAEAVLLLPSSAPVCFAASLLLPLMAPKSEAPVVVQARAAMEMEVEMLLLLPRLAAPYDAASAGPCWWRVAQRAARSHSP
jgi:hypothetical protein